MIWQRLEQLFCSWRAIILIATTAVRCIFAFWPGARTEVDCLIWIFGRLSFSGVFSGVAPLCSCRWWLKLVMSAVASGATVVLLAFACEECMKLSMQASFSGVGTICACGLPWNLPMNGAIFACHTCGSSMPWHPSGKFEDWTWLQRENLAHCPGPLAAANFLEEIWGNSGCTSCDSSNGENERWGPHVAA